MSEQKVEDDFIVSPEFEASIKRLRKNKHTHNVKIIEEAISIAEEKETHPKKSELMDFLQGMRLDQLARAEKDPAKKLDYVEQAKKFFKEDQAQMRGLEGVSVSAKMALFLNSEKEKNIPEVVEKLGQFSSEFQALGHDRDAKVTTVIQNMYKSGLLFDTNRPEAFAALDEAEAICMEEGLIDGARKMRSLKYHIQAKYQNSPQEALVFVKKSLDEIDQTADKHGKERAEADVLYLEALITPDLSERAEKFLSAGKLYLKDGEIKEQAYEALAKGYQLKAHAPEISIEEVQKYQKLSAESYEKAGLKRMAHNLRGGYYGVRAIKRGLMGGKNKWFFKDSFEAMKEFEKAGNRREFEFFMGNLALMLAKNLPDQEKIRNLEIAATLLNQRERGSGDFATYELFITKANIEPNEDEQRRFRKEGLKHLENFIEGLDVFISSKKLRPEMSRYEEEKKPFLLSLKSEACRLRASIADGAAKKREEQLKAKDFLEELRNSYPKENINAGFNLGMLYVEMEDFDEAISEFELALTVSPSNQQVKKALLYAQGLLRKGFREMREERELRNEFIAFHSLDVGEVPSHIEAFVPKVMRTIVRRGETFERSARSYSEKGETELRDEFLSDLNRVFPGDATSESMIGNGKTDLRIKNPIQSSDEAIGECKWWKGEEGYLKAKDQLLSYLPPRQPYGLLITFSKTKDFDSTYSKAKQAVESSDGYEQGSLRDFETFGGKRFAFLSRHKVEKGGYVWIYHILFNLNPGEY